MVLGRRARRRAPATIGATTGRGPVEETYFCIRGRLKLTWDQGEIAFGPLDSVYLAPGWHYRLENVGADEAFLVYNMTPAQE